VLAVQQPAQGLVQEPAPQARPRAPARAPELDQEVRARAALAPEAAQEQGVERAPEAQAQEAQGLQARAEQVAPREVLVLLAGACPALALPHRQLCNMATLGLRQVGSRRARVMPLQQLPLPAKDFLRLLGRSLSSASVN
jgi:hypothetical protein